MQGSDTAARDHGERPPREVMVHRRCEMTGHGDLEVGV
jgi:hypothetical protein